MSAFFDAAREEDPAVRPVPEADWRAFLSRPFNRGGREFALALEGERVAGVLTSTRIPAAGASPDRRHFRIVVHPAFRGRGIGGALLALVEGQDPGDPPAVLQSRVPASWTAAARFLGKRGFRAVQVDLDMERRGAPPPVPPPPAGVSLREATDGDDASLVRLHDEGYRGEFGYVPGSAAMVRAERATEGAHYLLAEAAGRPAGFCKVHHEGVAAGRVNDLVVAGEFRRRGIGRALLLRGLAVLHAAGREPVGLTVEAGNAAAVALYRSLGFVEGESEVAYWREAGRGVSRTGPAASR